jgi:hypothetical protein
MGSTLQGRIAHELPRRLADYGQGNCLEGAAICNEMNFKRASDNNRIRFTVVNNIELNFDWLAPLNLWAPHVSHDEVGAVGCKELAVAKLYAVSRQTRLPVSDSHQEKGKNPDSNGCDGSDGAIVGLQKIYDGPQGIDNKTQHRNPLIPLGFLVAVIGQCPNLKLLHFLP